MDKENSAWNQVPRRHAVTRERQRSDTSLPASTSQTPNLDLTRSSSGSFNRQSQWLVRLKRYPPNYTQQEAATLLSNVSVTGSETFLLLKRVASEEYPKLLILLRGVPGCGKTSLAKALYSVTSNGVICSADDHFLDRRTGTYNFNPMLLPDAHHESRKKCEALMRKSVSPIIIDNTNTKRFEMELYVKYAIQNNYEIELFEVETEWRRDPKILSKKNTHGVTREKIEDMLYRFEHVNKRTLIDNIREDLGEIGRKYCPQKQSENTSGPRKAKESDLFGPPFSRAQPSLSPTLPFVAPPAPTLSDFVMDGLMQQSSPMTQGTSHGRKAEFRNPRMAAVFPCYNGSGGDDVKSNFTDQNFSTGQRRRMQFMQSVIGNTDNEAVSDAHELSRNAALLSLNSPASAPSSPVDKLQSYFPSCPPQVVNKCWLESNSSLDTSINILLDDGYEICMEDVTNDNMQNCEQKQTVKYKEQGASAVGNTNNESSSLAGAEYVEGESYEAPNDGEDWVDMPLTDNFIKTVEGAYGEIEIGDNDNPTAPDKAPRGFSAAEKRIRIPPALAFDLFRLLHANAEKKRAEEAEAAATD